MPEDLPNHVGVEWHAGRPYNRWSDGRLLPIVRGGDGTAGDGDGDGGGDGDGDGDGGDDGDADLGEKGKKALDGERSARREAEKARKAAERKAADLESRLAKLEGAKKTDHEKELEKARNEAKEAGTKEATAKANARILRAEIKSAAAGKLADPADALRLLDLDDFEVDDDGEVDAKAITKAIAELVKDKPYLAAGSAGKPKPGSADGGARGGSSDANVGPGSDRLRRAYAASSKK